MVVESRHSISMIGPEEVDEFTSLVNSWTAGNYMFTYILDVGCMMYVPVSNGNIVDAM